MALPTIGITIESVTPIVQQQGLNTLKASNLAGVLIDISGNTTIPGNLTVQGSLFSDIGAQSITSNSANALAVGRLGATTPAFNVDASTASQVAGLNVKGAATGGTVALAAIDSGSNTSLTVDGKGTGTVGINTVSTTSGLVTIGNATSLAGLAVNGATNITSASATSLTVGPNGTTTPLFAVDSSTSSAVTGLKITGAATGGTVAVAVTQASGNANLTIDAKGSGTVKIGNISAGVVTIGGGSGTGMTVSNTGAVSVPTTVAIIQSSGLTAGGAIALGVTSVSSFGLFVGSGAPTVAAAQGSLYLRSDGTTVNNRAYINTNGSTTWTPISTVG